MIPDTVIADIHVQLMHIHTFVSKTPIVFNPSHISLKVSTHHVFISAKRGHLAGAGV